MQFLGITTSTVLYLVQSKHEGLKSGEIADKLEDPQDPHHSHKADYLACFSHDLNVLGKRYSGLA